MDWQVLTGSRLADAAAGGLIVLAAGSLAARLCRQPVRRARLIVLSLLGAMAVPALGALPIAPRWSVGLPAAPAAILARADHAAPAEAGSRPHPPGATGSRVALGPIEQPGEMPTGHARTGPALAPSGPAASARGPVASPLRADGSARELFRGGGRVRGLVARRAAPALARDPVGSTGPEGDPRRLPRARRPRGRAGRAARKRPDRLAVHLHLAPSRDPAALDALRRERARGPPVRPGARVVARRGARRLDVEPRLSGGARPLLSTPVLVAEAAASPLPGLPGRRPGRRRGLGRGLRRVPRPPRAGPQVRPGRPRAGDRRPSLEPLPEGYHADAGPRTAGAPLPGRLEPLRRHGRGRRDRLRLGAPPRCRATGRR